MHRTKIAFVLSAGLTLGLGIGPAFAGPTDLPPTGAHIAVPETTPSVEVQQGDDPLVDEIMHDLPVILTDLTERHCVTIKYYVVQIGTSTGNRFCGIADPDLPCAPRLTCTEPDD